MTDNKKDILDKAPDLSKFIVNPLYEDVANEIVEDSKEYWGKTQMENIISRLDDISNGLSSGIVGRLIYYNDVIAFYDEYKNEINQLLYELLDSTGLSISELFGDKWDNSDPLAIDIHNQNLLAWFAYEEVASQLRDFLTQD